ncbi:MAG: hypothetical protein BGO99_07920 [Nitrosospira sp. 56-18]|nr:MAG: hypothetical protein BGO99_07920 [Nitrosospira sp. 56-18]
MNESDKHDVKFLEAREDASKTLESAEQAFNFVLAAIHRAMVFPSVDSIALGGNYRHKAKFKRQLTCFITLIGTIHQQIQGTAEWTEPIQQFTAFGCIVRLPWRQRERYSRSSIRGNHMNPGAPSSARFADGLGSVFFNAPGE